MPSYATESGVPLTFCVMDMASVDALSQCNKACNDLVGEVLHAVASSSEEGVVLVMHVDEDGEEIQTLEITKEALKLRQQHAITVAFDNECSAKGHAHICVSIHLYTSARRNMPTSL